MNVLQNYIKYKQDYIKLKKCFSMIGGKIYKRYFIYDTSTSP